MGRVKGRGDLTVASVHGRFQPLHLGHMEYIRAALERSEYVFIGLTQWNIRGLQPTSESEHRALRYHNPLTYFERRELIISALLDESYERERFDVIPFPIETPDLLLDFLPLSVICLTTVYEQWNLEKIRRLESLGYRVEVLWERAEKAISGGRIRDLIRHGDATWHGMVPEATTRAVEQWSLRERLESLYRTGS